MTRSDWLFPTLLLTGVAGILWATVYAVYKTDANMLVPFLVMPGFPITIVMLAATGMALWGWAVWIVSACVPNRYQSKFLIACDI